jgi:hypothetical protein
VLPELGDAAALAGAVRRLAADAGLRSALVEGGLRTAEHWTVDRLADRLEALHPEYPNVDLPKDIVFE